MIKKYNLKGFIAVIVMLLLIVIPTAHVFANEAGDTPDGVYRSLDEMNGMRIGVQTGTTFDEIVLDALPDAKISYFNTYADMAAALETHKIDGFPGDEPVLRLMAAEDDKLAILDDRMDSFEFGFVLPKTEAGEKLLGEINAWLAQIKASGELDGVVAKWTSGSEADKTLPDYAGYPSTNGTLTMATEGAYAPMNYFRGDEVVGFEIDLAARFCEAKGYGLKVETMNFDGILPTVQAGKVDFAAAGITVTEERKESVNFSAPYYIGGTLMAVLKNNNSTVAGGDFRPEITDFSELSGKTISMLTGAPFEELISSKISDVKEFTYYQTMPDMVLGIKSGKTDAGFMNNAVAELAANKDPALAVFPESLGETAFGLAFAKGDERCALWQEAYDNIPSETKEVLWKKWTGADDSIKTVPAQDWPGNNGTVRVAACDALEPMSYVGQDGELLGLDIETILLIAKELDMHVEFSPMDFSAVLSSIGAGKTDIGCGSIVTTDERKETMDFVEYQKALYVLIVRSGETEAYGNSFIDGVKESFYKTFVREDRYKLFIEGICTTLIITFLSILFGTALGFIIYMLCRNGGYVPDRLSRFFVWLIQGMPVVVLLMILYYIIFGRTQISGTIVAVIAFTLVFGSGVFGMLKMGVGAVDKGQTEAALALGYGSTHTFFRIILPQALPHFLPSYKGEAVSLVKATAVVGYIAVQDLTKMGDIVRGRTYEAFFPLIAVAIIYFILGGLLTFIVGRIEIAINPRKRKREDILKGIRQGGAADD
ncbi:MAG: transporter substrate-binding domain-containing protein [Lachnospiraceae bacterium]|nr:transporter substrate-binding domain-containing protein [Lachnospiraceae bacterium]